MWECFERELWEWSDENKRERGAAAMGSSPAAICSSVCELGVEWSSSMYCFVNLSLSLIQWLSPVDVGGFAEPRKILCQCA